MIKVGSFFTGIGGFELGMIKAFEKSSIEYKISFMCEKDPFCQKILRKNWKNIQIYNDITKINTKELPKIDLLLAGFPCQDISNSGKKEGLHGKKSGLYWELQRIISDIRPKIICLENVSAIIVGGFPAIIKELHRSGYNAEWICLQANQFGLPHKRKRLFLVAYSDSIGAQIQTKRKFSSIKLLGSNEPKREIDWRKWTIKPTIHRKNARVPNRMDRIKRLGNSISPLCSEWVFDKIILSGLIK